MYSSLRHAVGDHVSCICPKQLSEDLLGQFVPKTEEMELEGALEWVACVGSRNCIPHGPGVDHSIYRWQQAAFFECLGHLCGTLGTSMHDLVVGHLDEDCDF